MSTTTLLTHGSQTKKEPLERFTDLEGLGEGSLADR